VLGLYPFFCQKNREREKGRKERKARKKKHFNISDLFQGPPLSMMFLVWYLFLGGGKSDTIKRIRKPLFLSFSSYCVMNKGKKQKAAFEKEICLR
jgi:hypothetical protein